ncbi:biopolymer transporter ExbD [Rhodopirellula sp. ICT_H3.1]|uniref:Biopolymer transporter ExbD n=2 Tax=Aporhodopirellula aestuarii TaxID=2950107 RepID=A0ABT0U2B6_9BACT|nr:biopolymer transporter ExbD [Aporhodopirellula aestuarii]
MTPMIDIVFLLIIFFLVSSHLSRQENRHPVTLAQAESGTLSDPDQAPLTLTLDRGQHLYFAGEVISMDEVPRRVGSWLKRQQGTTPTRDAKVRLRIDQSVPYGQLEPVLKELARLQIRDVAIVVNPRTANSASNRSDTP